MGSVTKRIRRGLRYEMVPKPCVECEIEPRATKYGLCMNCNLARTIRVVAAPSQYTDRSAIAEQSLFRTLTPSETRRLAELDAEIDAIEMAQMKPNFERMEREAIGLFEPIVYDPSDGSTNGVRGPE